MLIGAISAQENVTGIANDDVSQDVQVNNVKSFDYLKSDIDGLSDGDSLNLKYSYTYTGDGDFSGISITQNNIVIDGKGNIIDANADSKNVRIFDISGNNVTLKNLVFTNASVDTLGGAIRNVGLNLTIINSTFINNGAYSGAAISNTGQGLTVVDSTFKNNRASYFGGAIQNVADTSDFQLLNSTFINNSASLGGAVMNEASKFSVVASNFENNVASSEGGAIINMGKGAIVKKSSFINNVANSGEAIAANVNLDVSDNWWGSNAPNWNKLIKGKFVLDSYAILTLSANNGVAYVNFYNDETNCVTGIYPRNLKLTIGNEVIEGIIVNGSFKTNYNVPDDTYDVVLKVDNQVLSLIVPKMDVVVDDVTYGDDLAIIVDLPSDARGNATITVGDMTFNTTVENGKINCTIPNLPAGDYNVTVQYLGDDKYCPVDFNKTVRVARANPNISVNDTNMTFGENKTLEINLANNAIGNITITLNNKTYVVTVKNGLAKINIPLLDVGEYPISISYGGDKNYLYDDLIISFKVLPVDPKLNVDITDIKYGQTANITVTLTGINNTGLTGEVIITIEDKNFPVFVKDGITTISKNITLPSGEYNFTAFWMSNSKNYNNAKSNGTFNISKVSDYVMNVTVPDEVKINEDIPIIVDLPEDATGNVTITIDGKNNYTVPVVNGTVNTTIPSLPGGVHNVTVDYPGDDKYEPKTDFHDVIVIEASYEMNISAKDIFVGETAIITVNLPRDATGNVNISIDGKKYTATIIGGVATCNVLNLAEGSYNIIASYKGDNKYSSNYAKTTIKVSKVSDYPMNVTVSPEDVKTNENATITVNLPTDATGNVTITVDNTTYTVPVVNGSANVTVPSLPAGEHNISVNYTGDDKYAPDNVNSTIDVSKVDDYPMNVTIVPEIIKEGENATIIVDLPVDATGNVTITVDNTTYTVPIVNGTANITVPDLHAGKHNVTTVYAGDDKYGSSIKEDTFKVFGEHDVILTVKDVLMIYKDGSRLNAVLCDVNGNPIANKTLTFTINGVKYARVTNASGCASMAINLEAGVYNATVTFDGDDYYNGASVVSTVTINTSIIGNDLVKMWRNGTQFYATFLGKGSTPLANTNVTFNINGVFYTRQTNANGTAKLNINLDPGNYTLTAYNPYSGEQRGFNVLVKPLIYTNDLTKYYINGSKFEAKVYNYDGSLAANKNVTFNINGVFYTRTADENGTVKLAITLRPGDYIITSMYEGLSIGNKVKVLPTLETSDLSMKYQDGSTFKVKTLDGQGNPLANQNITFNIHGVFYHKTTNNDGIAELNINLNKGKYIITSYWNDYEIGNKITIS